MTESLGYHAAPPSERSWAELCCALSCAITVSTQDSERTTDQDRAYELFRNHFDNENEIKSEVFKEIYRLNQANMMESLTKRPVPEIEQGRFPNSLREITTPHILAAYGDVRERQVGGVFAIPSWDRWGPVWRFLTDIAADQTTSHTQPLVEDEEPIGETYSDEYDSGDYDSDEYNSNEYEPKAGSPSFAPEKNPVSYTHL